MAVMNCRCVALALLFVLLVHSASAEGAASTALAGDADPLYRNCVQICEKTGQMKEGFSQHCQFLSEDVPDRPWFMQEPLYLRWKQWNCKNDCHYNCMMETETERERNGLRPVKYFGKWPFKRVSVLQEPVSAALSAVNLIMHFNGWLSFFLLVHYKLPGRPQTHKYYYEYAGLWHLYGILAMNAWFWSAIYHIQDCSLSEHLDYSSTVALVGFSLLLSIIRVFSVKSEASRVMIAAPLLAFVTTHILYLNFYQLDLGLNMKVSIAMSVFQFLLWAVWATVSGHPSRLKIWFVVIAGLLSTLLEIFEFPPYMGYVDAHAVLQATEIPLAYIWWSFVSDDAAFRTCELIKKAK